MERRVAHTLNMYSHLAHLVRVQLLADLGLHVRRQDLERRVLVRTPVVVRLAVRGYDLNRVQKVDASPVHAVAREDPTATHPVRGAVAAHRNRAVLHLSKIMAKLALV